MSGLSIRNTSGSQHDIPEKSVYLSPSLVMKSPAINTFVPLFTPQPPPPPIVLFFLPMIYSFPSCRPWKKLLPSDFWIGLCFVVFYKHFGALMDYFWGQGKVSSYRLITFVFLVWLNFDSIM